MEPQTISLGDGKFAILEQRMSPYDGLKDVISFNLVFQGQHIWIAIEPKTAKKLASTLEMLALEVEASNKELSGENNV